MVGRSAFKNLRLKLKFLHNLKVSRLELAKNDTLTYITHLY